MKILVLGAGVVILIFVIASQPQIAFGIIFLICTLAIITFKAISIRQSLRSEKE